MSLVQNRPMTLAEFLAWEERQPLRYEFDGYFPVAMTGGTAAHAFIQCNIAVVMTIRLRGQPCQFVGSDLKIQVNGRIRYPDGFVVCAPVDPADKLVTEPVVIFEVLSDSTGRIDSIAKNRDYAATPSVRRYIMLAQDEIGGVMFERIGADWVGHILPRDVVLRMPEIGVEVPLAEFYDGVAVPVEPDGEVTSSSC
jgi:Uma2 family endonuclease